MEPEPRDTGTLERWLDRQLPRAAAALLSNISPLATVRQRPAFAQTVRPRRGAIVAALGPGAYDPEPDYFFHWYRDAALVIDALRLLYAGGIVGTAAFGHLADFVDFNMALRDLDGRTLVAAPAWRSAVAPGRAHHLRAAADLAAVHGAAVAAEARVNPDATLDILRWSRPQHDGPALRALALLRWLDGATVDAGLRERIGTLVRADLAYTLRHWREPSFDIWEEEAGAHYYTLRVAAAALDAGADWFEATGAAHHAPACRAQAGTILAILDGYWLSQEGYLRSRVLPGGGRSPKDLDSAVILAANHAAGGAAHGAADVRQQATLDRLEAAFAAAYPINRDRPAGRAPAMGRYIGDSYYSGGAYYFSTLGAAEFCFRAARDGPGAAAWRARGDAFLETVRAFTPASGAMSEQFDQRTGAPASAPQLAWSHAAFISCVAARRAAAGTP